MATIVLRKSVQKGLSFAIRQRSHAVCPARTRSRNSIVNRANPGVEDVLSFQTMIMISTPRPVLECDSVIVPGVRSGVANLTKVAASGPRAIVKKPEGKSVVQIFVMKGSNAVTLIRIRIRMMQMCAVSLTSSVTGIKKAININVFPAMRTHAV